MSAGSKLKLVPTLTDNDELFAYLAGAKQVISIKTRSANNEDTLQFVTKFTGRVEGAARTFWLQYPVNQEIFEFKQKLQDRMDETFVATIHNRGTIYGVSFKVLYANENGICCQFPESLHHINRRKSKRVRINTTIGGPKVWVELQMPQLSTSALRFPIVDVSIEGLSFWVSLKFHPYFLKEQIVHGHLWFGGKSVPVALEIRNMFYTAEVPATPYKVGVRFVKLAAKDMVDLHYLVEMFKTSI